MLLNEFLKEHRKVKQQDRTSRRTGSNRYAAFTAAFKAQAAQIQKVSDQLRDTGSCSSCRGQRLIFCPPDETDGARDFG